MAYRGIVAGGVIAAALAAIVPAPRPGQVVSYAYDGAYVGGTSLNEELSDPACPALSLTPIEIRDGALRAWDRRRQTVKGLITHDGFFNADYYDANGAARVFEGTIVRNGALVGGVITGRCAYLVALYKSG